MITRGRDALGSIEERDPHKNNKRSLFWNHGLQKREVNLVRANSFPAIAVKFAFVCQTIFQNTNFTPALRLISQNRVSCSLFPQNRFDPPNSDRCYSKLRAGSKTMPAQNLRLPTHRSPPDAVRPSLMPNAVSSSPTLLCEIEKGKQQLGWVPRMS